jgi:uncharacterized protein
MTRVVSLRVFPVKGCRPIPLESARVAPTGLLYDRHWMVVSADTGRFITQRQESKLCQVAVNLPPEALLGEAWGKLAPGAALELSTAGMPALHVPLTDPAAPVPPSALRTVTVWDFTGTAADEGDEAAAWFTQLLGRPARLVRCV